MEVSPSPPGRPPARKRRGTRATRTKTGLTTKASGTAVRLGYDNGSEIALLCVSPTDNDEIIVGGVYANRKCCVVFSVCSRGAYMQPVIVLVGVVSPPCFIRFEIFLYLRCKVKLLVHSIRSHLVSPRSE